MVSYKQTLRLQYKYILFYIYKINIKQLFICTKFSLLLNIYIQKYEQHICYVEMKENSMPPFCCASIQTLCPANTNSNKFTGINKWTKFTWIYNDTNYKAGGISSISFQYILLVRNFTNINFTCYFHSQNKQKLNVSLYCWTFQIWIPNASKYS